MEGGLLGAYYGGGTYVVKRGGATTRGVATNIGEEETFDIIEGDVVASTLSSTHIDTPTLIDWHKTYDVGPSNGKWAMTFSYKMGEGFDIK